MALDFTTEIPFFLWEKWQVHSGGTYLLTMLFSMLLAISIEAVPFLRWYRREGSDEKSGRNEQLINKSDIGGSKAEGKQTIDGKFVMGHLLDTFLQMIAKTSTYLLMLMAMTYNFGLIAMTCVAFAGSNFVFEIIKDRVYIR